MLKFEICTSKKRVFYCEHGLIWKRGENGCAQEHRTNSAFVVISSDIFQTAGYWIGGVAEKMWDQRLDA
jgi:hypothetical protein